MSEGFFRVVCSHCHQIRDTVNPRNNLAHCFCCQKNINNIDLMLSVGYDFKSAVALLRKWLKEYKQNGSVTSENEDMAYRADRQDRTVTIGEIFSNFSQSVGKR
jgi:DNA primase